MPRLTFEQQNVRVPTSTINQARLTDDSGFQNLATGINRLGKAEQDVRNLAETNRQKAEGYKGYLAFGDEAQRNLHDIDAMGMDPLIAREQGQVSLKDSLDKHEQEALENGTIVPFLTHAAPLYLTLQERFLKDQDSKIVPWQKGQLEAAGDALIAAVVPLYGDLESFELGGDGFIGPIPARNEEVKLMLEAYLDMFSGSLIPVPEQNELLRKQYNKLTEEVVIQGLMGDAGKTLKDDLFNINIPLPVKTMNGNTLYVNNSFDMKERQDLKVKVEQELSRQVARENELRVQDERRIEVSGDEIEFMIENAVAGDPHSIETWRNNLATYGSDQLSFDKKKDLLTFLNAAGRERSTTSNPLHAKRLFGRITFGSTDGIDRGLGLLPSPIELANADLSQTKYEEYSAKLIERRKSTQTHFDSVINDQASFITTVLRKNSPYSDKQDQQDVMAEFIANDFAMAAKQLPIDKQTQEHASTLAKNALVEGIRRMRLHKFNPLAFDKKSDSAVKMFSAQGDFLGTTITDDNLAALIATKTVDPEVARQILAARSIAMVLKNPADIPEPIKIDSVTQALEIRNRKALEHIKDLEDQTRVRMKAIEEDKQRLLKEGEALTKSKATPDADKIKAMRERRDPRKKTK